MLAGQSLMYSDQSMACIGSTIPADAFLQAHQRAAVAKLHPHQFQLNSLMEYSVFFMRVICPLYADQSIAPVPARHRGQIEWFPFVRD